MTATRAMSFEDLAPHPILSFSEEGPFYRAVRGHFAYEWHGGTMIYVFKPRSSEAGGGPERMVDEFAIDEYVVDPRVVLGVVRPTLTHAREAIELYEP